MTRGFQPRAILAIKNKHLGDVICGVPAFKALHDAFPSARLDVLITAGCAPLVDGFPWIHRVIESPRKGPFLRRIENESRVAKAVVGGGYDLVVDFTWSDRAMWYALASGASRRWAIQVTAGSRLKPHVYNGYGGKPDRSHHVMEHEREFLVRMGIPHYDIEPAFPATPDEDVQSRNWLAEQGISSDRLVLVHPTSRWLFKCWHDDRVAEVIDHLANEGWQPVVTCGPSEAELKRARNIINRTRTLVPTRLGDLGLRQLASMMRQARFFFGMDSAPSHMASAVGLPAVVLFGPSQVKRWRPFGDINRVIHRECPCIATRGSGLACDKSRIVKCMDAISVDEVVAEIDRSFPLAG